MSAGARRRQAALQETLLRSMVGEGPPPDGLDPARVSASGNSLAAKRVRSVARAWPDLAEALGGEFRAAFEPFAAATPQPARGPLADGLAFARWLDRQGRLPDAGRLERLAVSLRYRATAEGLDRRRGLCLRAAWIQSLGQAVVAVRLTGRREFWFRVPIPRRLTPRKAGPMIRACSIPTRGAGPS